MVFTNKIVEQWTQMPGLGPSNSSMFLSVWKTFGAALGERGFQNLPGLNRTETGALAGVCVSELLGSLTNEGMVTTF